MADALLTPSIIAKEALMQLENNLVFGNQVHREYKKDFVKVGNSVSIRRPVKFVTTDGVTLSKQDVEEGNTSITIDQRKHVGWDFLSADLTLTIEKYSERYIQPAMITLAQTIDSSLANLYQKIWNQVGTPGTTPASYAAVSPVAQRMDEMSVPRDGQRKLALNPEAGYAVGGAATALFMEKIAQDAYRNGAIGKLAGLETYSSQNIKTHTVGIATGTPLVNGASQEVTYAVSKTTNTQSLITDGWTSDTAGILKAGDVFTIAGVFAVNPVPGEGATGKGAQSYLQQFTVLADAASGATTGPSTLSIAPAIIVSGPYQTVTAAPADDAAITVMGTGGTAYPINMGFHKNALALVTVPLEMPDGAAWKARESHNGISIRAVKDYDITNDQDIIRLDVLYGVKAIYPDLATRLIG